MLLRQRPSTTELATAPHKRNTSDAPSQLRRSRVSMKGGRALTTHLLLSPCAFDTLPFCTRTPPFSSPRARPNQQTKQVRAPFPPSLRGKTHQIFTTHQQALKIPLNKDKYPKITSACFGGRARGSGARPAPGTAAAPRAPAE